MAQVVPGEVLSLEPRDRGVRPQRGVRPGREVLGVLLGRGNEQRVVVTKSAHACSYHSSTEQAAKEIMLILAFNALAAKFRLLTVTTVPFPTI